VCQFFGDEPIDDYKIWYAMVLTEQDLEANEQDLEANQ